MATQRQYEGATVFSARIVDMRHLWTPSTEYKGQQTQKPNYFAMFIVPKTQAQWNNEPALAGVTAACGKLFQSNPYVVQWPIIDGDIPNPEGKQSEFAKGHWMFSASSGNPPNVELAQPNGQLVKLANRVGVKPGDHVMCGVTAAVKKNDPRGVKMYLNAVVFTSPGEEIVFANSVSGAELMRMAQQQGLQVAGFATAGPAFGGAPGGGFPGSGGFNPNGGAPGFTPGNGPGFVPTQGGAAPAQFASPPNGPGAGPGSAFPSNPGTQPFPGPGNQQYGQQQPAGFGGAPNFNPGQGAGPFGR